MESQVTRFTRALRALMAGFAFIAAVVMAASSHAASNPLLMSVDSERAKNAPEPKTQLELDREVIARFQDIGRKVDNGIALVDGRNDWKVDYEFVSGDPAQPLIVLANGFIWPRENAANWMNAFGKLAIGGGPAYNLLRYDMSGQAKTVALYKEGEEKPWWIKDNDMTVEQLRHEMAQVVRQALKKNGLPENHPVIMMSISYGSAILSDELAAQTKLIVEIAPMIIALDKYDPSSAAWRAMIEMTKAQGWWNPFAQATAYNMQKNGWITFYQQFYKSNPDRMPTDVVPEYYLAGSALRTNAVADFDANKTVFKGIPTLVMVSEVDDKPLVSDQLDYFQNTLVKEAPAALIYMHQTAHGQTADFFASDTLATWMANVDITQLPQDRNIFRMGLKKTKATFLPTTIEQLKKIQAVLQTKFEKRAKQRAELAEKAAPKLKRAQEIFAEMEKLREKFDNEKRDAAKTALGDKILKLAEELNGLTEELKALQAEQAKIPNP